MGQRIVIVSDFSPQGSGYFSIMSAVATSLSLAGHDVKVIGMEYRGEEHNFPFSLIPCANLSDAYAMTKNLEVLWPFQVLLVGFDIPIQLQFLGQLKQRSFKYIAVTPIENPPLCVEWAIGLFSADHIFCISEIGTKAMQDAGIINAEHLVVGVSSGWLPMTVQDKIAARKLLGYSEDDFLVFANADNQERKNLNSMYKIISRVRHGSDLPIRLLLVTRENNPYGNKLRSLAHDWNISDCVTTYERGLTQEQLRVFYNIADVYFQTSKGEGLGMPLLEAMGCGCPVIATNTGAMTELLSDGRGWLIDPEYTIEHDVWGNSKRDFISIDLAANAILEIANGEGIMDTVVRARQYVLSRTLEAMGTQVVKRIEELCK